MTATDRGSFDKGHDANLDPDRRGFREVSFPVEISSEERAIGIETKRFFDTKLSRPTPWAVNHRKGRVEVYSPRLITGTKPGELLKAVTTIKFDDLEQETLTPALGGSIFTSKRIEDNLPDFMRRTQDLFRKIWGISDSYNQWGKEEGMHSSGEGVILVTTGFKTQEELEQDYVDNSEETWELPFSTPRQMAIYGAIQEEHTRLFYMGLAARALEEDALNTAAVMELAAQDEGYHFGGYVGFVKIFAEHDLEGTIEDVKYVAANFRMPAQNQMIDPIRSYREMAGAGGYGVRMTKKAIERALTAMEFVPKETIKNVVVNYNRNKVPVRE